MNLPNKLTISRFIFTIAFLAVMFSQIRFHQTIALVLFVAGGISAFVGLKLMPAWMVVIIVARELAITGLRLLAVSKQVVLAAEGYGKHKTISQIVAIIAILIGMSYGDWGTAGR